MPIVSKRWVFAVWLAVIFGFALLHGLHLRADFPNHTPWFGDWAKYTDEGWYGNAAIRAHLFGNWYLPGDFNPAPALPAWPFLEWLLFFFTGVTVQAARGLAVGVFFANLLLSYLLLRARGPRWMALLALTLMVTSPFLYCFSRLAILEPMLTALMLAALNLAIRVPGMRHPLAAASAIGLLFTLMLLTKTTAVFLLPALGWALLIPLWQSRGKALRCGLAAAGAAVVSYGLWMAMLARRGLLADYRYLFTVNTYPKPTQPDWPLQSLWWSIHGGLWIDHILIPLAWLIVLGTLLAWRTAWGQGLLRDPVFGVSVLAVAGYTFFMTYQDHPQPRYFAVVAFFGYFVVVQGAAALLDTAEWPRQLGWGVIALAAIAAMVNAAWTLSYVVQPEYTFVDAAQKLTGYIDQHPSGKRLLVSTSSDEITLLTHLPTLCDDFGTEELEPKLSRYQPGWFATWNDVDPVALGNLHERYSLEQAATFRAFDDPQRNDLVLFKLHPLAGGRTRKPGEQNLRVPLAEDKIDIPMR